MSRFKWFVFGSIICTILYVTKKLQKLNMPLSFINMSILCSVNYPAAQEGS